MNGVKSGVFYGTETEQIISTGSANDYVFLFAVEPSQSYTILYKNGTTNVDLRFFNQKPPSVQAPVKADFGARQSTTTVVDKGRYATITTDANTSYITVDPRTYLGDFSFVVCKGVYDAKMWDNFSYLVIDKTINANILNVEKINSPMLTSSKNLFSRYSYGFYPNGSLEVATEDRKSVV